MSLFYTTSEVYTIPRIVSVTHGDMPSGKSGCGSPQLRRGNCISSGSPPYQRVGFCAHFLRRDAISVGNLALVTSNSRASKIYESSFTDLGIILDTTLRVGGQLLGIVGKLPAARLALEALLPFKKSLADELCVLTPRSTDSFLARCQPTLGSVRETAWLSGRSGSTGIS